MPFTRPAPAPVHMLPGFHIMCSMKIDVATQTGAIMAHQMLTYSGRTRRMFTVPTMFRILTMNTARMTPSPASELVHSRPVLFASTSRLKSAKIMTPLQTQPLQ